MDPKKKVEIRKFNRKISIRDLLHEMGAVKGPETSIYCPFHPDEQGGKKSMMIKDVANIAYCFSDHGFCQ